jgi:hypothetical protein
VITLDCDSPDSKALFASLGCCVRVVVLLLFQTITDEVIESGAGIGTHMIHHLRT